MNAPHLVKAPAHPPVPAYGVSQTHAARVGAAAAKFLDVEPDLVEGPFVCPPGFHAGGWTVAYEGDYDWPHRLSEELFKARALTHPGGHTPDQVELMEAVGDGFYLEAVSGWCVGIYEI